MNLSVLQFAGPVVSDPYPHVIIHDALPADLYSELARTRPAMRFDGIGPNERLDTQANALLNYKLPPIWRSFITYHTSQAFWFEVLRVFGSSIKATYPHLEGIERWPSTIRFAGEGAIHLDCILGINTPTTEETAVRGPHVDAPNELFGGLLYMRDLADDSAGGEFAINRLTKKPVFSGKAEIDPACAVEAARVPYRANTFVGFVNASHSVHSVTPRSITPHIRKFVSFAAEVPFELFNLPTGAPGA